MRRRCCLLTLNPKPDTTDDTVVFVAACEGHEGCLCALHGFGCDMGQPQNDGATPASIAAAKGHEGCLRLLHGFECDMGQPDKYMTTPAHAAAKDGGHEGCLRLLHEFGCDMRQPAKHGDTPALLAVRNHLEGCLHFLLHHGVPTLAEGGTLLEPARKKEYAGCVAMLEKYVAGKALKMTKSANKRHAQPPPQ